MNDGRTPTRRGAAYLIALLAGTIVTITGLSALSMATSRAKENILTDQSTEARLLAQSAFEHGLGALSAHLDSGDTRADLTSSFSKMGSLSDGQLEWTLSELDGSALDNVDGPIVLRAKASNGQATHIIRGILPPSGDPYDTLATAMYVGGELSTGTAASITADKTVGAIGDVTATGSTINAPVESSGTVSGAVFAGSTTSGADARTMPDDTLFDYYLALGEYIDIDLLPSSAGYQAIEDVLLSPSSNPYGNVNEFGIYIIDCSAARRLIVRRTRIVGTLVILDSAMDDVIIGSETLIEPAFGWMPSLLIRGGATFMGTTLGPSESTSDVDFNPSHTPYDFGFDDDKLDVYPGRIEGLAYVSGNVTFSLPGQNFLGTIIIGGNARVSLSTPVNITYDPDVAHLPPYGFFDDTDRELALDPSTIVWELP